MYVTAGLNDPRVGYWEPAKWVAKLRATKTGHNPLLLRTEMGAGHQGPSGRYDAWRDEARVQSFMLSAVGGALTEGLAAAPTQNGDLAEP
jgi:oligopeptidase B